MLNKKFFLLGVFLLCIAFIPTRGMGAAKCYALKGQDSYNMEYGKKRITKNEILKRIAKYREKTLSNGKKDTLKGNAYICYSINVKKKNVTLNLIPSMFQIARGKKKYAGEYMSLFELSKGRINKFDICVSTGTIPKNKGAISIIKNLLIPNIYGETIFGGFVLSPCNLYNKSLYEYKISRLTFDRVEMIFRPKVKNTQLISGKAIINESSGRILSVTFRGEIDMLKFNVRMSMGNKAAKESDVVPKFCEMKSVMNFMGNKVESVHRVFFNAMTDSILTKYRNSKANSYEAIERLRPMPLQKEIKEIYDDYNNSIGTKATVPIDSITGEISTDTMSIYHNDATRLDSTKKKNTLRRIMTSVGNYFVDKTSGNFGTKAQGNYRISPLMNPLSLGYSNKKGLTYKLRLYGGYKFSENSDISLIVKSGYSFKQKQFYTSIPMNVNFNKHISLSTEFGVGNRITNSEILDKIKNEKYDSIKWDKMNLDYFKDLYWRVKFKYKLNEKWNLTPGIIYHKRSATDKQGFILSERPYKYHSFAPTLQIQYLPWIDKGPVFTVDYERGIKGVMHSSMDYERIETDISWKKYLHSMRILSMKLGYGLYTSRSKDTYFLDFTNFRYENIPGGWEDDWTGEFQLLNSNWYNASTFYSRANVTYESPLLIMSWLPVIGKYIETERIYSNWLLTDILHPYVEFGYGFTNKFFSMGMFVSMSNKKYSGFGMRFSLELFKDW